VVAEPWEGGDPQGCVLGTGERSRTRSAEGQEFGLVDSTLDPRCGWDECGQPIAVPDPLAEPSWTQVAAMGYLIPGIGVVGGDIVAGILERFDTRIARVLLDERTGVVIETGIVDYLPNRAMRRFLQKRDGTCRFPGCARGAKRCEPDHIIAFSRGGPTAIWNLISLCKHHHRVKHNAGWTLTMTRLGVATWTDPHGRQYVTHPINHHELAA